MTRQTFFFSLSSLRLFVISEICFSAAMLWFVASDWRRGIGQMEVSIKEKIKRCCHQIGVATSRWFHSRKWQHLLIWPFNFKSNSFRLQHLQSLPVIQNKALASGHKHTHTHTQKKAFNLKLKFSLRMQGPKKKPLNPSDLHLTTFQSAAATSLRYLGTDVRVCKTTAVANWVLLS